MKAKLIKTEKMYVLSANNAELHKFKSAINTSNYGWVIADEYGGDILKLSAKNCDEIFGVLDVEKLVQDYMEQFKNPMLKNYRIGEAFNDGFQKALELMGDKKFSEFDVRNAYHKGYFLDKISDTRFIDKVNDFIQSLQQTEWEVEVEMDDIWDGIDSARILPKEETSIPMLDKDGCLILKRVK
jgi:hypothetical protein